MMFRFATSGTSCKYPTSRENRLQNSRLPTFIPIFNPFNLDTFMLGWGGRGGGGTTSKHAVQVHGAADPESGCDLSCFTSGTHAVSAIIMRENLATASFFNYFFYKTLFHVFIYLHSVATDMA